MERTRESRPAGVRTAAEEQSPAGLLLLGETRQAVLDTLNRGQLA